MKQTLQLKLSQHLTLTPQLQQSIRLLQLSTLELNQELEQFLMENPLLEREDGEDDEASARRRQPNHRDAPSARRGVHAGRRRSRPTARPPGRCRPTSTGTAMRRSAAARGATTARIATIRSSPRCTPTLREHLLEQVCAHQAVARATARLVDTLIDALDEDGYLTQRSRRSLEMLPPRNSASSRRNCTIALHHLQSLDPTGRRRAHAGRMPGTAAARPARRHARRASCALAHRARSPGAARRARLRPLKRRCGCDDESLRAAHSS